VNGIRFGPALKRIPWGRGNLTVQSVDGRTNKEGPKVSCIGTKHRAGGAAGRGSSGTIKGQGEVSVGGARVSGLT